MIIKSVAPTLAVLAWYSLSGPGACAVTVSDSDWQLSVGGLLQGRADSARSRDDAGNDYDIDTGSDDSKPAPVDFFLRRARVAFKATYRQDTGVVLILRADGVGHPANSSTATGIAGTDAATPNGTTSATGTTLIQQGFVFQTFQRGSVDQQAQIGLDYAFHNRQSNVVSSADNLLPNYAMPAQLLNNRSVGVGYRLNSDFVTFGADVQNNAAAQGSTSNTALAPNKAQGLWYSARIELTGPGWLRIARDTETFIGAQGTGLRLGLDVADNVNARTGGAPASGTDGNPAPNSSQSTLDYGIDLLGHWDGLTALVEERWDRVTNQADIGASAPTVHKQAWNVQAGYAIPLTAVVLEPALRYERADFKDAPGTVYGLNYYGDYGNSGKQIDVGVNVYWAGNRSKTSLEYSNWKSLHPGSTPATGSTSTASIFRLQQQLVF